MPISFILYFFSSRYTQTTRSIIQISFFLQTKYTHSLPKGCSFFKTISLVSWEVQQSRIRQRHRPKDTLLWEQYFRIYQTQVIPEQNKIKNKKNKSQRKKNGHFFLVHFLKIIFFHLWSSTTSTFSFDIEFCQFFITKMDIN